MLLRYKKTYEKIAMGLLSYMPVDKSVKKLQEMIYHYETDDQWQLFLLKEDDDFIGLVGVIVGDTTYTLQHISVNPSFRGEGIGKEMVMKVQALFSDKECKGTEETDSFINKCKEIEEGTDF
ncbi:GNAT family N-acetyltransferase [Sporosarcina limicola]|uniref:Riboflavin biosynthesis RibT protein n=1 Tax=Sporosarcina limicola TaxID=34101 RepID=A0A927MG43_9BACL|nr:GNAT family N-acetyltransferase [Sporosarcina limicola]MBE1554074.1 riboflavin biosynthesis RibT protein [Sporosarcina limicola]